MLLKEINDRISVEYDPKIIKELSDECLGPIYKNSPSFKASKKDLEDDLLECFGACVLGEKKEEFTKFVEKRMKKSIKPGLKGQVRGLKFNEYVKTNIESYELNTERFEIMFEKNCPYVKTDEIPDWYIFDKQTKKCLIGMNQLDLWNGGAQTNRAGKYLKHTFSDTYKIICVVANFVEIKKDGKLFNIFQNGFTNNTLCYTSNLFTIIKNYFLE